jgi:hypothetical protein
MKKIFIFSFAIVAFFGCKKEVIEQPIKNQDTLPLASISGGNGHYDAHFYVRNVGSVKENEDLYIEFAAEAKGSDGIQSYLGDIEVSTNSLSHTAQFRGFEWSFPYRITDMEDEFLSANNNVEINADGNQEFGVIHASVNTVDYLFLSKPLKDETINSSSPILIQWNEQNSSNGVAVYVELLQEESKSEFPSMTFPSYISYEFITEDDGEYEISPSELSSFPENCVLRIWVGRGNYTEFKTSTGKDCLLAAYSMDLQRVIRN